MRVSRARAVVTTAAGLAVAYALPALAAAPVGRSLFRTVRRLEGVGPGRVGLTFDDGPEPEAIGPFLDALDELGVKATFFVVGEQVARAPDAARKIVAAGHEIACHGYRHLNHLRLTPRATVRDLQAARDTITGETGADIRHFRPPYGVFNATSWVMARKLGWERVLWARWGRDWEANASPKLIQERVMSGVRDGDVILLHDAEAYSALGSWRRTLGALAPIITDLRSRGLEPGPVGLVMPSPAVPDDPAVASPTGSVDGSHNGSGREAAGGTSETATGRGGGRSR